MSIKYQSILVAIDGSKESDWAFHKAIKIAKESDALLVLAHVIDVRAYATVEAYDQSISARAEQYAKELLEKYDQLAIRNNVPNTKIVIEYGSPKVKIPKDIAQKYNIDLIVCGATGLNAVERFFIGSVSEHIVRFAKCDVLVVRSND